MFLTLGFQCCGLYWNIELPQTVQEAQCMSIASSTVCFTPRVRQAVGSGELQRDIEQESKCRSRWKMAGMWRLPILWELSRSTL